jgi:hypothetical protein
MLQLEAEPKTSIPAHMCFYLAQVIIVPCVVLISAIIVSPLVPIGTKALPPALDIFSYLVVLAMVAAAGAILGFIGCMVFPLLYPTGVRTWVLPGVCYLILAVAVGTQESPALAVKKLLDPRGTDEGLGVVLLTMPVLASCGYSIGMFLQRRRSA